MANNYFNNDTEINEWKKKNQGILTINKDYSFNNSNIILQQDLVFINNLKSNITGDIEITPTIRTKAKKKYQGIDIKIFNDSLRKKLSNCTDLLFEVYNDDGVFYTSKGKKGFDFGKFDFKYNLINLRNICFGRKSLYNGKSHWNETLKNNEFIQDTLNKNPSILNYSEGDDIPNSKSSLTILGELQFANWGLAYRDLFKLLQTDSYQKVDLFVYVTATNNLLSYASENIVSFEDTKKILNEFSNLIKIPVWVIGLDIEIL